MKYLKYTLFIMIIFLNLNVFADSYNVTSTITSPSGGSSTGGKYQGTELNGGTGAFNVNTRYNGTLTNITYNLIKPDGIEGDCFWTNMTYTITMEMATQDWRNRFGTVTVKPYSSYGTNWSNGRVTFVSMKKIYFTFKIPNSYTTCQESVVVNISSNDLFTPFTGETNWNLSKITLADTLSSGGSSGGSSTPTPTPQPNNQDIIDNQTQNANNIIDNQTQNASDIIENANNNTESILIGLSDSQFPDCANGYRNFIVGSDKSYISDTNGRINPNNNYFVSTPIKIKANESYTMNIVNATNIQYGYFCFYDRNLVRISCTKYTDNTTTSYTFTSPTGAVFFRATLYKNDNVLLNATIKGNTCVSSNYQGIYQDTTDEIKTRQELASIDNAIKDDSIDDKTGFFTNFNNNTHGLTSIITLPLSTIQNLANTSCVTLSIPVPFTNDNFTLPCMTQVYQSAVPDIYSMWQVVSFGIISYYICIDIFKMVKGFKDPNEDKVEVLDL